MNKTLISMLLLSAAVCVTPASANYFSNARLGVNLNVGSAPNPKPAVRPFIAETPYITGPNTAVYTPVEPAVVVSPAALPPQTVTEVAPVPPPAIRRFVIFFDFDKSDLTAQAKDVVSVAVMTAQETGMVQVIVTGHTDTVGSERYNQALSERRAGAVKTEIISLGMDARDINAVGANFSEPLVATGLGIREPQNRRAVIDLGYTLTATIAPSSAAGE